MPSTFHKLLALSMASLLLGTAAAEPLPVTASFSILGDLVREVGGERVRVTTLVGPNQDAHAFTPKPTDAKAITHTKLLVINGLNFEPWATKLANSAGYQGATVVASTGVAARDLPEEEPGASSQHDHSHHHEEADPHAWQNPMNVKTYVHNIANALASVDPAGRTVYQANASAYAQKLSDLDNWATAQFASLPADKRKVITSHDAFGHFAAHYGIKFLAPKGLSTDAEPSAKDMVQLIRQIKREKIKAVFIENMSNPKLLAQLAKDTGVQVGPALYSDALSAPDQPGATYLKMMRHNITQLAEGMQKN